MAHALLPLTVTQPRPAAPPDRALVSELRRGSPAALAALYHEHAAMLLRVATHVTGNAADGEDVVQDLFVALPEALARYEERGQLGAWLRGVCIRLALQRLRAARRWADDDGDDRPAPMGIAHEERLALVDAIAALPDSLRVVFVLREVEGYSHAEIAALLGIRRNTSEVRHHRAIRQLRTLMGDRP